MVIGVQFAGEGGCLLRRIEYKQGSIGPEPGTNHHPLAGWLPEIGVKGLIAALKSKKNKAPQSSTKCTWMYS